MKACECEHTNHFSPGWSGRHPYRQRRPGVKRIKYPGVGTFDMCPECLREGHGEEWKQNPFYHRGASAYRRSPSAEFRPVTISEVLTWYVGQHFWIIGREGKVFEVRTSGRVKTWKRDPERVEVPFKYGMYENGRITSDDILAGRVLQPV